VCDALRTHADSALCLDDCPRRAGGPRVGATHSTGGSKTKDFFDRFPPTYKRTFFVLSSKKKQQSVDTPVMGFGAEKLLHFHGIDVTAVGYACGDYFLPAQGGFGCLFHRGNNDRHTHILSHVFSPIFYL